MKSGTVHAKDCNDPECNGWPECRKVSPGRACRCRPKCLDCRDGVHDGCVYECR